MAGRRKAEIQLQMQIETQEEWEDLLSKEGLNVIDVYQDWCGPCSGMLSNFKKIKNEVGDPLLKFATAKADTIDSLDKYRGHCEPCFLFYAGGCLVAVVRGANSPKILRTITEQLTQEHKVLDGNSERKEIKDPFVAKIEAKEKETEKEEEEEEEEATKEVTVALIKPDAVQAGKVDQILEDIKAAGIEVLRHEERKLTEEEVREIYSHLQDQGFFDELVQFMTSGPSHVLALTKGKTGENIISEFRDLIGPTDVEEAKTQKPESLRAKHGQQTFMNALHGSSSREMATRELAFFFPDFAAPIAEGQPKLQRTLALVRPEAFRLHKEDILSKIRESGFKVAMQKEMTLTREMAEDFYKEHKGQEYFDTLVTNMSSGPVLALGLAREDAIEGWRNMLGPKEVEKAKEEAPESLRAKFAVDDAINALHGSDSEETAKKELQFFFPMEQTVAVIKPDAEGTKEEIVDRIHEAGFRIAARKETLLTRDVAEEFYSDHKGKEYYNDLVEHMTSGPTLLMVLSREGAVEGWRSMIGPTDPSQAKEVAPDSLRATYGQDILKNAVHGSSDPDHAKKTIQTLFGDLKFKPDGTALDAIDEEPEREGEEKAESDGTKDAEETAPEYRDQQGQEETKQEEQQPSDEQTTKEESKTEESEEQKPVDKAETEEKSDDQKVETVEQKENTQQDSSEQQEIEKESPREVNSTEKEQKAEPSSEDKKEEEPKAPSPKPETEAKPSETEAKPSESEAKPSESEAKPSESEAKPSETEAKPSESEAKPSESESKPEEKQEEQKTEDKKSEEPEQKTETQESTAQEQKTEDKKSEEPEQKTETQESTAQGEEEKKEETKTEEKTEEKAPETQASTEESKEEKKEEETKAD